MARTFFDHEQFDFELQIALGGITYGAGDVGEMLATADRRCEPMARTLLEQRMFDWLDEVLG